MIQHIAEWIKEWGFAWMVLIGAIIALAIYLTPDWLKRRL